MSINVLQLIGSFNQGGSERQAVQLTRLLREDGRFHVLVATLDSSGPLGAQVQRLGLNDVPEYPLTSFYDRNAVTQMKRFVKYLKQNEVHVVHAHDFYTNIFGMTASILARVPVRIASRRESSVRAAKQRFVERGAYKLAQKVVANCEEVRQQLILEGVSATKVTTLYNGLDLSSFAPQTGDRNEVLASLGLPVDVPRRFITIVANMRAHFQEPTPVCLKDHPTFLRAAKRVHEVIPDAAFVIAGEGEMLEATRKLAAELGIEKQTFFLGRCENVPVLLSASFACVLSSTAEGFSNSILEYMAAGRPVVATRVGGAAEAIEEGSSGYLVNAGDDESLAERLIRLLSDTARAEEMGQRGKEIVSEKFSSEAQLRRTTNLYDELLNRQSSELVAAVGSARRGNA
ncbi:MAG TPA: glycosyltransferase [Pyrinomonadaceae bacterium]|nr:glycosyltransferase [Pyrinomonadaceae bacterium]